LVTFNKGFELSSDSLLKVTKKAIVFGLVLVSHVDIKTAVVKLACHKIKERSPLILLRALIE
jgi:hypothetical protein